MDDLYEICRMCAQIMNYLLDSERESERETIAEGMRERVKSIPFNMLEGVRLNNSGERAIFVNHVVISRIEQIIVFVHHLI